MRTGSVHDLSGLKIFDCLFLNISLHGARLRLPSQMRMLPTLIVCDERLAIKFIAQVRWQLGHDIGIFIRDGVPSWMPYFYEDGGRTTLGGRPSSPRKPDSPDPLEERRHDWRSGP